MLNSSTARLFGVGQFLFVVVRAVAQAVAISSVVACVRFPRSLSSLGMTETVETQRRRDADGRDERDERDYNEVRYHLSLLSTLSSSLLSLLSLLSLRLCVSASLHLP